MSYSTLIGILDLVFVDLIPKIQQHLIKIDEKKQTEMSEVELIESVRNSLTRLKSSDELWKTFCVKTPSLDKEKRAGLPVSQIESDVVAGLIELARDQYRTVLRKDDGELDRGVATPIELKNHEKQKLRERETAEKSMRVNKSTSNKDETNDTLSDDEEVVVVEGGGPTASKGNSKKRPAATQKSIAVQEREANAKKEEVKRLRKESESRVGGAAGGNALDEAMSGYFAALAASKTSAAQSAAVSVEKQELQALWDLFTQHKCCEVGYTVEDIATYLDNLGCFDSSDLKLLSREEVGELLKFVKGVVAKKITNLLLK